MRVSEYYLKYKIYKGTAKTEHVYFPPLFKGKIKGVRSASFLCCFQKCWAIHVKDDKRANTRSCMFFDV